jgi:hypothetical protein
MENARAEVGGDRLHVIERRMQRFSFRLLRWGFAWGAVLWLVAGCAWFKHKPPKASDTNVMGTDLNDMPNFHPDPESAGNEINFAH